MIKRLSNPYIAGKPVTGLGGFFGRSDILGWVLNELRNPNINTLVLSGQRRIGKTSLLKQIEQALSADSFIPIYFDLMNQATRPLEKVLSDLAEAVIDKVPLSISPQLEFDNYGKSFQKQFLPAVYHQHPYQRPVFLLDEFDVLDQSAEAGLSDVTAAKALFPFLRKLIVEDAKPVFIFVVGRRTEDLTIDFGSMFKTSLTREIWVLDSKDAKKLICQAEENNTLKFKEAAVQRILDLGSGHPYLTQLLCQRIWERTYSNTRSEVPVVDIQNVNDVIEETLDLGKHAITWLWNGLGPAEKIYAAALAEISNERQVIPEDRVIQVISANASRLRTREVELAPRDLVKRRVLQVKDGQQYSFAIELFRLWVKNYKPLREVKDELDRMSPMADRLFSIGRDTFGQNNWESAIGYFKDALEKYPQHFRSRLYLGETYIELNQLEKAIDELEKAYQLDSQEAKFALIRAYILKAKKSFQEGGEDDALAYCEKILSISPNEYEARKISRDIWVKRGDNALKQGDLRAAMIAFRTINLAEKIKEIEGIYREQELARIEVELSSYAKSENWDRFIATLLEAESEFPQGREWGVYKSQAEKGKILMLLYQKVQVALSKNNRTDAIKALVEIINYQPDYKDTARKFLEVIDGTKIADVMDRYVKTTRRNKELSDRIKNLDSNALDLEKKVAELTKELEAYRRADSFSSRLAGLFNANRKISAQSTIIAQAKKTTEKTNFEELGLSPPITQTMTTYVLGDDLYDESFGVETGTGEFLGEFGVGISEFIGVGEPKKVTAFEIWLFDKNDIKTATKVLMSAHSFSDSAIRSRLEPKGELVLIQPQSQVLLETATLQMLVTILDIEYGKGALPDNSYFERVTLELAIWPRQS